MLETTFQQLSKQPHRMLDMPVALCGASQRDQRNASQSCGASQRLATPRNALATRISRTRYAQRPERDSTAGERNESNAMHRRHRARQTYEIATRCAFQSTAALPSVTVPLLHGGIRLCTRIGVCMCVFLLICTCCDFFSIRCCICACMCTGTPIHVPLHIRVGCSTAFKVISQ